MSTILGTILAKKMRGWNPFGLLPPAKPAVPRLRSSFVGLSSLAGDWQGWARYSDYQFRGFQFSIETLVPLRVQPIVESLFSPAEFLGARRELFVDFGWAINQYPHPSKIESDE